MEDVLGDGIDDRIEQAVKKYMDELLQNSEKKI